MCSNHPGYEGAPFAGKAADPSQKCSMLAYKLSAKDNACCCLSGFVDADTDGN